VSKAGRIGRRAALALAGTVALPRIGRAQGLYVFDQTQGKLEFTARHMAMFNSTGEFRRFQARLSLDPARLDQARVQVEVETASAVLAYPGANELLRSPAYFDSARFPVARFAGRAGIAGHVERFPIVGELEIRGIRRPMEMEAQLVTRRMDPAAGTEVAEFTAGGEMRRSEFGMTADTQMISDAIRLTVTVRLAVGGARAG